MGSEPPRAARVVLALAAVYLIWGSTYLAIRFAIETLPPLAMAGTRFVIAGAILMLWTAQRGVPRPTRAHWLGGTLVGALLLLGGNGGVVLAERTVPSGLTAVIVALVPAWMVLLHWLSAGERPTRVTLAALVVGFAGVALLVNPGAVDRIDAFGTGAALFASLSWAAGSLYSRRAPLPADPLQANGVEQLAGGALLLAAATLAGEWGELAPTAISAHSLLSLGYLVVFGSLVGFTAYLWLLRAVRPALASTYAYVNPVVAVFLGWALAAEPVTARTLVAAGIILVAVATITSEQARQGIRARRVATSGLAGDG